MSGDQKLTNRRCKTCSTNIEAKSVVLGKAKCSLNMPEVPRTKKRTR